MIQYDSNFDLLREDFIQDGIDISKTGFYDDPNFKKNEKNDASFLNNYANYIEKRSFDSTYLKEAKKKIEAISKIVYGELLKDNRNGACIDLSMVLSRILDKKGIWNYIVSGSLTIDYPTKSGLAKTFL